MIIPTLTFTMRLILSSYQGVQVVGRLLSYAIPYSYSTMAPIKGKINFNTKHLKTGDPLPPFNGKLRIYNMRFCPYAQRTILALLAKKIDCEVVNIDLVDKPEWLTSKSPFSKVPALEISDGVTICESLITVEYLDEVYPQRPLLPKDPLLKAEDKVLIEATGPVHALFYKLIKAPETVTEETYAAYYKALNFVQDKLKSRGTKFLDGSEPGFADYMIWPWFERIRNAKNFAKMIPDEQKYPVLVEYLKNMLKDPVVQEYLIAEDVQAKFLAAYSQGKKPDYDLLYED